MLSNGNLQHVDNRLVDTLHRSSRWYPVYDMFGHPTGLEVADFVPMSRSTSSNNFDVVVTLVMSEFQVEIMKVVQVVTTLKLI